MADEHTLNQALMIGDANKAWVPCSADYIVDLFVWGTYYSSQSSTDGWISVVLPLPSTLGALSLHIDAVRLDVYDADADDYINSVRLWRYKHDGYVEDLNDGTNRTAAGQYTYTFTAADCAGYGVGINVFCVCTTVEQLRFGPIKVRCWYE